MGSQLRLASKNLRQLRFDISNLQTITSVLMAVFHELWLASSAILFLHLLLKKNLWVSDTFFPVTQTIASNHWNRFKAAGENHPQVLSFLYPPLDSWWKQLYSHSNDSSLHAYISVHWSSHGRDVYCHISIVYNFFIEVLCHFITRIYLCFICVIEIFFLHAVYECCG